MKALLIALAATVALVAACAPAPVVDPDASAIYATAFGAHEHELPRDAKALLFASTVRGGLEHVAIAAGHDPDAPVATMRDAIAARLSDTGFEPGAELDAFLSASQADARELPDVDVAGLTFVRIDEDDYRERIATTRDCAAIFADLGFDDTSNVGLWFASPIGFDDARTHALVYVGRGDVGELLRLRRADDAWRILARHVLWRS